MTQSFIPPFKLLAVLTVNRPVLIKYKYFFNCVSLLWILSYPYMVFLNHMKAFLSKIHLQISTFINIISTSSFKGMMLYSKSFYQAWNCWISFKSQAKWKREEGNQREQFISSWERAVSVVMSGPRQKLVRLSCQGNVMGRNYIVQERVLRGMFP